ncbi:MULTISPECIES: hypothetical protein [Cupriavidus]
MAYIVNSRLYGGRVVEVLYAAPIGVKFRLPDGAMQVPQYYDWVCRFPTPVEAPMSNGATRMTHFGTVPDRKLRPIGGVPVHDEQHDEVVE